MRYHIMPNSRGPANQRNQSTHAVLLVSEESRLLEELKVGSQDAYEALVRLYYNRMFNLASRLLRNNSAAPDVVQEAFLKAFRRIDTFPADMSIKTWLFRLTVNEAYDVRRWWSRHTALEISIDEIAELMEATRFSPAQIFDVISGRERRAHLELALSRINPKFSRVVILRHLQELSYEEICDVLEVNLGTLKSRLLRGYEALRKVLAQRYPGIQVGINEKMIAVDRDDSGQRQPTHSKGRAAASITLNRWGGHRTLHSLLSVQRRGPEPQALDFANPDDI
jgi:RNA polymerase sigma-70 factor (ECF subfamily)